MTLFRRGIVFLVAALVIPAASAGQQTCVDRDLLYRLDGNDLVWNDVRAVSTRRFSSGRADSVLSGRPPLRPCRRPPTGKLGRERRRTRRIPVSLWNSVGRSPCLRARWQSRAVVHLRVHGRSETDRHASGLWNASQFSALDPSGWGDTVLLGLSVPMGNERSIIARSFGASAGEDPVGQDTVIVYPQTTATKLRLTAPGAPSLTPSASLLAEPALDARNRGRGVLARTGFRSQDSGSRRRPDVGGFVGAR